MRDEPSIGRLEEATRLVRRRLDGELVWNRMHGAEPVYEGDAVFAAEGSAARLALDDGSWIDVEESSLVVVRRPVAPESGSMPPEVAIEILRGAARGTAGRTALRIRGGAAAMALQPGARGNVRLQEDGSSRVELAEGRGTLEQEGGGLDLAEGERRQVDAAGRAGAGAVARIRLRLPRESDRMHVESERARAKVAFSWDPLPGGSPGTTRYRVEVAEDAAFAKIVARAESTGTTAELSVPAGVLRWRVRSGDAFSAERLFVVAVRPPPVLYRPRVGEALYRPADAPPDVTIAWTPVGGATEYAVELAREDAFDAAVLSTRTRRTALVFSEVLAEGRHCARVRIVAADAGWSAPTCFQVVTASRLRAPRLLRPELESAP